MAIAVKPGTMYEVQVSVTNQSLRSGSPTPATLTIEMSANLDGVAVIPEQSEAITFGAGEMRTLAYQMSIPGDIASTGAIIVRVIDPSGSQIASGSVDLSVVSLDIEPSQLLIAYRENLAQAIRELDRNNPNAWIMVAGGWGLQFADTVFFGWMTDPDTKQVVSTSVKDLMIEEAINIGMIGSSLEAYFERDIMFHISGDTIVPYWWTDPYDGHRFRSPAKMEAHIQEVHAVMIDTKGAITYADYTVTEERWSEDEDIKDYFVTWRNDSPFAIKGKVEVVLSNIWGATEGAQTTSANQDVWVSPGGSLTVVFPDIGMNADRFGRNGWYFDTKLYSTSPVSKLLDTVKAS